MVTLLVTVVGSAIAVLIAWATASVRDDIGVANVGLLLAIVCVAAALSDWFAGSVTSLFAALSLNFFHTEPVHSLRINQTEETASVVLLLALGVMVSAASAARMRRRTRNRVAAEHLAATGRLRELLQAGGPALTAWHAALDASNPQLGLLDARLAVGVPQGLAVVARTGDNASPVTLAEAGAAVVLPGDGATVLVVRPQPGVGQLTVERAELIRFSDQLAASLTMT